MQYGFVKVATATPEIRVADCVYNTQQIIACARDAIAKKAQIICFPELCVTGYTCGDLFFQPSLQHGALTALTDITAALADSDAVCIVGLPFLHRGKLFNCAAIVQSGKLLGLVPKSFLPNYNEFYEKRHFTSALPENDMVEWNGQPIPFGPKLLFACSTMPELCFAVEICEDLWAPLPPSTAHAMAGATLICNLSASDETIGKAAYRRSLVGGQSARLLCGYVYCDAGHGESTSDMVFAGHNLIAENGVILAESQLFQNGIQISEIDVERLTAERMRNTSFAAANNDAYHTSFFSLKLQADFTLSRAVGSAPFVPQSLAARNERCESILAMQAEGLKKRLEHTHARTAVVGISGGLDSSLALLVMVRAFQALQRPISDIIAITMPCFGTTARTRSNAEVLCQALGVTLRHVDITATVKSNFSDIGQDEATHDVTFENVQARVRTLVLMNTANKEGGLVIGTGDLSELALGWATYNGDHMSMYGVNCSVPKTLIRHLISYCADTAVTSALREVLQDILATPVSPELLPAKDGKISQCTEDIVGPYALHDFFLYYAIRWGFSPRKVFFLACNAFENEYPKEIILKWLRNFYVRFFSQQFKRNCLPDGPKVGSVTLSPRGDWRMPSDASAALWLAELDDLQ